MLSALLSSNTLDYFAASRAGFPKGLRHAPEVLVDPLGPGLLSARQAKYRHCFPPSFVAAAPAPSE